jgi:hypothetical protein
MGSYTSVYLTLLHDVVLRHRNFTYVIVVVVVVVVVVVMMMMHILHWVQIQIPKHI